MVLHGHELRPSMLLCHVLHHGELIGPHRAGADIPNLPALHQIVQSFHSLFDGGVIVEAMNLKEINVVRLQAFQGCIDRVEDGLSR